MLKKVCGCIFIVEGKNKIKNHLSLSPDCHIVEDVFDVPRIPEDDPFTLKRIFI